MNGVILIKKQMMFDTIFIIIAASIAKILSFLIRILFARTLSMEAMHYYTLISPTLMLALTLSQLSFPLALSKMIAKYDDHPTILRVNRHLLYLFNGCIMILLLLCAPFISRLLQTDLTILIYTILPILPLTSISASLKGRLSGLQKHKCSAFSQIPEEIVRIVFLIIAYPYLKQMNDIHAACAAMWSISISELGSIIYLLFNLPKQNKTRLQLSTKQIYQEFLQIAIPASLSRFIGSLTYFIEPLLLSLLSLQNYLNDYTLIYGYLIPLITMPSFLAISLSNYLLPSFVYYQEHQQHQKASKLCFIIICSCAMIGISSSLFCYYYGEPLLMFLYQNHHGIDLLKALAIPFSIYSLQPALAALMHGLNLSKQSFYDTLYGCLFRIIIYFFASFCSSHILILSLVGSMLLTTILHAIRIAYALRR